MADNDQPKQAEELQKKLNENCKTLEAASKQHEKLGNMCKKALTAAKKIDQLWK